MKVFRDEKTALKSVVEKEIFFLNGNCPYATYPKLCGNWCALFYLDKGDDHRSAHVILGCKAGEKLLFVEEIIGE